MLLHCRWKVVNDLVFKCLMCSMARVRAYRNQVLLPTDMEIWEAVPWPEHRWAIPNNSIVCTQLGMGITALGGGDYDGDI
jgi:hypothetical protein